MIFIGADHEGFKLKEKIVAYLKEKGFTVEDLGTNSEESVDYPDYARAVAKKVAETKERGILVCGSGTGMVIGANRVKGIRAAMVYDDYSAEMSRKHNDSNVICLRARDFDEEKTMKHLDIWLNTKFSQGERHIKRIEKLDIE